MEKIQGAFGFWKFSFLNRLLGRGKSIEDHKIISGNPNYISRTEIETAINSRPWEIEFIYDTTIDETLLTSPNGNEIRSWFTDYLKGDRLKVNQEMIDELWYGRVLVHTQRSS